MTALCGVGLIGYWLTHHWAVGVAAVAFGSVIALRAAWMSLAERTIDVNLLMVLAAAGAVAISRFEDAAALLFLFSLSNTLEEFAMQRTKSAIEGLIKLRPHEARRLTDDGEAVVPVEEIQVGDRLAVRPYEQIPVDGEVVGTTSFVDESVMTGESEPVSKRDGDQLLAGTQNLDGALVMVVTQRAGSTTLDRIVALVKEAQDRKGSGERISAWFGSRYTVFVLAAFAASWVLRSTFGASGPDAFYASLTLLVALSPCAVVISSPAATLSALAWAGRRGMLIRGGEFIEAAATVDMVAMDKTGTLTYGKPALTQVCVFPPRVAVGVGAEHGPCWRSGEAPEDQIGRHLAAIAALEAHSTHPLAHAICQSPLLAGMPVPVATEVRVIPGQGIEGVVEGRHTLVGRATMFPDLPEDARQEILEMANQAMTVSVAKWGDTYLLLGIRDEVRPDARAILSSLRSLGIAKIAMLTGDSEATARAVAAEVPVDEVHAGMTPETKSEAIAAWSGEGRKVMMVGDGVNDAPALTRARLGVAMGGLGSDIALNAADVVLMRDRLACLPELIALGRATQRIIRMNLVFAVGMITFLTVASIVTTLPLPLAVLGHEGSTVLVILNGLRLLRFRPDV